MREPSAAAAGSGDDADYDSILGELLASYTSCTLTTADLTLRGAHHSFTGGSASGTNFVTRDMGEWSLHGGSGFDFQDYDVRCQTLNQDDGTTIGADARGHGSNAGGAKGGASTNGGGGGHGVDALVRAAEPKTSTDDFANLGPVVVAPLTPVLEPHTERWDIGGQAADSYTFSLHVPISDFSRWIRKRPSPEILVAVGPSLKGLLPILLISG